ncbi:GTP cyclohydrolase 1 type 2/Nif3 [Polychytrium aggregatum]|uniref:GTP cyclohydrolase 1 type 2/Nif3 n=1 Tax=Polychytrium aggregatum TaxID=110093 RepID=UPI0022FEC090|nr:GTP cyclohydrolase 1 type 2/Nif3 [Polychytrium aggregatum]KAI9190799.1 GTP cyclohydrolase 1 type 2/Nif3 [Polychytrium aggregatum]
MSLLSRVMQSMERIAPLSLAELSWDNVGLLLEAPLSRAAAHQVFLTIDLTDNVLDEALSNPSVGVIVAYHPPLFRSFKRLQMADRNQRIALKCAAAGVSIYSPHTSLDSFEGGINDWLASGLRVASKAPITLKENPPAGYEGSGSGRICQLQRPIPLCELVNQIKLHLGLSHLRVASTDPSMAQLVRTVGICAGSGSSVLGGTKADVYWTGEMSHHEVLDAVASNTSVILCEHTNTERGFLSAVLKPRLEELLNNDGGPAATVLCSTADTDPLRIV